MSTAAIVAGTAAAGIGGAAISANAAGNAASTQAGASEQAAQLQYQAEQQALQQQQLQYGNSLQLLSPNYMQGEGALANLSNLLGLPVQGNLVNPANLPTGLGAAAAGAPPGGAPGNLGQLPGGNTNQQFGGRPPLPGQYARANPILSGPYGANIGSPAAQGTAMAPGGQRPGAVNAPGGTAGGPTSLQSLINPSLGATGSLMQPWTQQFQAPTNITEQNDPGYQARLNLGMQAIQNSAAASGDLLSGNTLAGLNQFGQDYASNEYSNVYNRAFNQYATSYNQFQQNQANQYNRLANLAGLGQTTAGQLATIGQNSANSIGNTLLGSAGQIGNSLQNAGAARASGYVGAANAWGGALGGLGSLGSLLALTGQLGGGGGNPGTGNAPVGVPEYGS